MSNMIFRALLSGLNWEAIIRTLGLRERVKGIGDGGIEGYRYAIIQRGDEILIVLPDYQPREKCHEIAMKIFSKLAPKSKIQVLTMGYASSICNYCLAPTSLPYRCQRCEGWYCESHRLPEQHNCPEVKRGALGVTEQIRPKKKENKEEIVVAEVPCG
jgi:hypothetical protein